jgi:hypothetical protein
MVNKELKKRDAILAIKGVVDIPKYKVLSHQSIQIDKDIDWGLDIPKGTKTVAVIYLG